MSDQSSYISRKLIWTDSELKSHIVKDENLLQMFNQPLVILGEPGMGKTRLMEKLGDSQNCIFIRATSFLRQQDGSFYKDKLLVIDGLDEVAAIEEGDPLHNVLKKLIAFGKPRFIISCRSAEWRGVTSKLDILDEYHDTPLELALEPLSEEDAILALSLYEDIDGTKSKATIEHLNQAGLAELFGNPLTLEFVAAVVKAEGNIPITRAELFGRAVSQLSREENQRHANAKLANLSEDDALDAAGALSAVMLITGQDSLTTSLKMDGAISLSELSDIGNPDSMRAVLGSRLFRVDTEYKFIPLHRSIAEYLGARWLAKEIEQRPYPSRTAKRLLGLISAEGGVPASLRGLHAWLPMFSPERLGPAAIDRDPYGILSYGDSDGLSEAQIRHIVHSLKQLAAFDPVFRRDWERGISFQKLASYSLRDELRAIISTDTEPFHLRLLILEAINKSSLAKVLQPELTTILFDSNRTYAERKEAGEAICNIEGIDFDWPATLEKLINCSDEDSTRLATALLDDIGFSKLSDELIAKIIITESGILDQDINKSRQRPFGTFYHLGEKLPENRISSILDAFTKKIIPTLNTEMWWDGGYSADWSEFSHLCERLILRQLQNNPSSVSPRQLWDWMRTLEREHHSHRDDRKNIAEIFKNDTRLRQGVQRLALFAPGTEANFWQRIYHTSQLSSGLALTDEDARLFLSELVNRRNPAERDIWKALVNQFRADKIIPKDIQNIALPYAGDDKELVEFLTKIPKRAKLEEWELKHRRNERKRKLKREQSISKAREQFSNNIEDIRRGELRWIYDPARAYLGMFSDLKRDSSPAERIAEWLGDEIRDAALEGFEAVLHRSDLPKAKQIAESYAESRVWNFAYPMLAGAGRRHLKGLGFEDLSYELLSALAILVEHEPFDNREQFKGLKEALDSKLRSNFTNYESYLRQKFEPMLNAKKTHISGLYQFTRDNIYRPLSTKLSLEWLLRFSDLPLQTDQELVDCIIQAPEVVREAATPILLKIAETRLSNRTQDSSDAVYWRSVQFLLDFNKSLPFIPKITMDTRHWLWPLTNTIYSKYRNQERYIPASLEQLKWIVENFRYAWPYTNPPSSGWSGSDNPWDAAELLVWAINHIAKDPSNNAAQALIDLRNMPPDSYSPTIQAAIAIQHRVQLEARFISPSISDLKAVLSDEPPHSAADVQAIVLDELVVLQKRLRGDQCNLVNNFYTDDGKPRTENECRDQMLIALGSLPFSIQSSPEFAMPHGKRSDGAFIYGGFAVPIEAKGQWNESVWNAAELQLGRYYSIERKAENKGIYIVFWFGSNVSQGKRLRRPPKDIQKPSSAEEMQLALQSSIPTHLRNDIAVVVLDLTRP